ncbi:MAG: hypothetical protein JO081_15105 [Alphaproteobacteria bacterium]|nr:hypothetical protein [Alphaproteobacteria bacterium]
MHVEPSGFGADAQAARVALCRTGVAQPVHRGSFGRPQRRSRSAYGCRKAAVGELDHKLIDLEENLLAAMPHWPKNVTAR